MHLAAAQAAATCLAPSEPPSTLDHRLAIPSLVKRVSQVRLQALGLCFARLLLPYCLYNARTHTGCDSWKPQSPIERPPSRSRAPCCRVLL